jgi:hypothetical protein
MWDDVLRWFDHHGSGVSAIAALAAAIIAVMTLIRTRSDSRRRSQPSVIAEIRPAKGSHTVIDFIVRNTGPTTARDVTVSFDPPITIPEERKGETLVTSFLIRRYSVPIPTVAPGQELTNSFWVGVRKGNQIANDEPTPDQFTVSVKYRGIGRPWLRDSFAISVDTVTLSTWSESHSSKSVESRVGEIAASLKTIAKALPKP